MHCGSTELTLRAAGLDRRRRMVSGPGAPRSPTRVSDPLGLLERMRELAARWTRLAEAFKTLSETPGAGMASPAAELARGIARDEQRFHEEVAAFVP